MQPKGQFQAWQWLPPSCTPGSPGWGSNPRCRGLAYRAPVGLSPLWNSGLEVAWPPRVGRKVVWLGGVAGDRAVPV